jgi:hypothetical protein
VVEIIPTTMKLMGTCYGGKCLGMLARSVERQAKGAPMLEHSSA